MIAQERPLLPAPRPRPDPPLLPGYRRAPLWRVLLHNDDEHDMLYVISALMKAVPSVAAEEAARIMFEAHYTGVGLVTVCPQEEAEYYQDRIMTFGLACTIEPAEE